MYIVSVRQRPSRYLLCRWTMLIESELCIDFLSNCPSGLGFTMNIKCAPQNSRGISTKGILKVKQSDMRTFYRQIVRGINSKGIP